ncbi:hypothetical protein C8R46DRAFT_1121564 [Mycena filopes]|nr:hypothetical protein C8R46DRAFT_1121564 [Mycena filopes]
MHPAFRLGNLDALSPALQDAASQLLESKNPNRRSLPDQLLIFKLGVGEVRSLLPVWYDNLDPAYIPTVAQIDAAQVADDRIDRAVAAVLALQAIVMLRDTPEGIYPKLWTRTWPWIEFLHTYAECLIALPPQTELYGLFVAVFVHFQVRGCREPVESTPSVRTVVGAAWDLIIQGTDEKALRNVSLFVNFDERKCRPKRLKEYMEGAGGGIDHFASILRRHVDRAVGNSTIPMSDIGSSHFTSAIGFMMGIMQVQEFCLSFRDALLRQGILGALTAGITSLVPSATEYGNGLYLLAFALNLLGHYTAAPPGLAWVSELLQSGFLRVFALIASTHPGYYFIDHELESHVRQVLTPYMVYRSILLLMPHCLSEVEELTNTDGFKASAILPRWQAFCSLVQDRLAYLQLSDAARPVTPKSCDNIDCFKIQPKSELSRCSTCLDSYYCSRACQSADWRAGHREACAKFAALRRLPEERQLTLPDKTFLRHLLYRDYLAFRAQIYAAKIAILAATPTQLTYVLFDYMHGPPTVTVRPWPKTYAEILHHPDSWMARYYNHGGRAARSQSRLEVHLMAIPNGLKTHWKLFPMRHVDWEIPNVLWKVAEKLDGVEAGDAYDAIVAEGIAPLLATSTPRVLHE